MSVLFLQLADIVSFLFPQFSENDNFLYCRPRLVWLSWFSLFSFRQLVDDCLNIFPQRAYNVSDPYFFDNLLLPFSLTFLSYLTVNVIDLFSFRQFVDDCFIIFPKLVSNVSIPYFFLSMLMPILFTFILSYSKCNLL